MKYRPKHYASALYLVAPFAGAWIEIQMLYLKFLCMTVAPFAGAWIEISLDWTEEEIANVAPFAGAWIEIGYYVEYFREWLGRSLRGSVD